MTINAQVCHHNNKQVNTTDLNNKRMNQKNRNKPAKVIIGERLTCKQACPDKYRSVSFMAASILINKTMNTQTVKKMNSCTQFEQQLQLIFRLIIIVASSSGRSSYDRNKAQNKVTPN